MSVKQPAISAGADIATPEQAGCPEVIAVGERTAWALVCAYPNDKARAVMLQVARVGLAMDIPSEGVQFYWMGAETARFLAKSLAAAADAISDGPVREQHTSTADV